MMKIKKTILSAVLLFAAISTFTSCIIEEGGYRPRPTQAGLIIYHNTSRNISSVLEIADIALKLDLYLRSPENEKAGVMSKYFLNYVMTQSSGEWIMKPTNNVYAIKPDSKSLNSVGAKWEARAESPYYYDYDSKIPPLFITIECTGDKTWKITVSEKAGYNDHFIADYTITGSTPSALYQNSLYAYNLSGSGHYMPNSLNIGKDYLYIDYTIKTPMRFVPMEQSNPSNMLLPLIAVLGKIDILVSNDVLSSKLDHIIVELISQSPYGVNKIVTFNGVTETWNN